MTKVCIEFCLISARGLRHRSFSFCKLQWYAVGWIDPNSKFCTTIDSPGSANPLWETKFSASVDLEAEDLVLHIEVYRREPIFLRESLQGIAAVYLKEFLDNYKSSGGSEGSKPGDGEICSFQLRKGKSGKPQGFVDVSVKIVEAGKEEDNVFPGHEEGFQLAENNATITLPPESRPTQAYPYQPPPLLPIRTSQDHLHADFPYATSMNGTPPPPPSNAGYIPTFFPRNQSTNDGTYVNLPSSGGRPARGAGPGVFGMGVGAGALVAGATIFGDDFTSGFNLPAVGLQGSSLEISANPLL